jgi:murein L,D-transpeptidase YcbB/YkuD
MVVLRIALLAGVFVAMPTANAATDDVFLGTWDSAGQATVLAPRHALAEVRAVEAALATAESGSDPVEKIVIQSVRDFYKARAFTALWFEAGELSPRVLELRERMDSAAEYGLDPSAYATPQMKAQRRYYDPERVAAADVAFSIAAARFVMHISSGRIRPTDISSLITLTPERQDLGRALWRLSQEPSLGDVLASYEPPHPQYHALKAKLAEMRALGEEDERVVVPEGALLKPGMTDGRAEILRVRLGVVAAPDAAADLYDDPLVDAVRTFQEERGLNVDGIIGPATLLALNGRSREEAVASLIANMERWRWMPRDLGAFHVMVNVPEFIVRVVDDGTVVHQTRVVVGRPQNPTPTFSHVMSHLVVNPYWNVPTSIVRNEMLPEIRANPWGYFARGGYQVLANVGGSMRLINPARIDWYRVNPGAVRIRQVPGDHNSLGRIKFMFPNQHSVYLHDTPAKSLFERDSRAFSHGCVRVQNPLEFADAILPVAAPDWNSSRLEKLYGGNERRVNLDHPVPVHIAYFTDAVGPDGELHHFDDIYGYDSEMTEYPGF